LLLSEVYSITASASRLPASETLSQASVFETAPEQDMSIKRIFQNENQEWRCGWRVVAMIALLAIAGVAVSVGWKALGLPGQKTGGPRACRRLWHCRTR